jgi:hypothetical protein
MWLAGCGGMNGILGGGNGGSTPPPASSTVDVRGTIEAIDPRAHTLTVSTDAASQSNLRSAERKVLSYNSATVVQYQGQTYHAEDLERGDRIAARAESDGNVLWARNITVLSSVSGNAPTALDLRDFDATVRSVNTANRTIELAPARGDGRPVTVAYDSATRVDYQGRSFKAEDLENGDQVRVTTRGSGDRIVADRLTVTRNVSETTGATAPGQLHGTVRQIDTSARTIALDGISWAQGFNPNVNANAATIVYDAGTVVEYRGRRYGIANLEPGDVVDIELASDRRLARRIVVSNPS